MNAWENLEALAAWFDSVSHRSWVLPVALILVILMGVSVAWALRRLRSMPSVEEMADPRHNPDLDRLEAEWRRQQGDDRG